MLKSSDGKDTKKELSPNLSKLVLKMFMNAKSTKTSCSGSQQPICSPVSLWDLDILSFIFLRNEDKDGLVSCLYPMLCASVRGGFC
jgi:hypothetical protein